MSVVYKIFEYQNATDLLNIINPDFILSSEIGSSYLLRNRVFKIMPLSIVKIYAEKSRWYNEVSTLKYLSTINNICSPKLINESCRNGLYYIQISCLPGQLLGEIINNLTDSQKTELLYSIGAFHAEFHKKCETVYYGDWSTMGKDTSYEQFIKRIHVKYYNKIISDSFHKNDIITYAIKEMEYYYNKENISNKNYVLCHNDFGYRNLLVVHKKEKFVISGIIDFENSYFAQREFDLTRMLLYFGNKLLSNPYLDGYRDYSNINLNNNSIIFYMLLKCLRICSWAYKTDMQYYCTAMNMINIIKNRAFSNN